MNAMEFKRKQHRHEKRVYVICVLLLISGMMCILGSTIGVFHGFHPIPVAIFFFGLMQLEAAIIIDHYEGKRKK